MNNSLNTKLSFGVLEKQGIPEKQRQKVVDTATKLFEKIPNIKNCKNSNIGLLVGKVQSGKTSVMIATSALAFSNGHRLIIALLSDTELLLNQNYKRISETFAENADIVVRQASRNGDFSGLSKEDIDYCFDNGKKLFICGLKNKTRVKHIIEKFANSGFVNEPVLVFDDEGDDISQNTACSKKKFRTDENGEGYEAAFSVTNKEIKNLKESFKHLGYVSVTATPQANVLLQTFQHMSPDYVLTISPGVGYCGLSYFHSEHHDELIYVTDDDKKKTSQVTGIPKDLKIAFAHFVAGAIIRKKREKSGFKHSMMIHTSRLVDDHETVTLKMNSYVEQLKNAVERKQTIGREFLTQVMEEGTNIQSGFSTSLDELLQILKSMKVVTLNGKSLVKDIKSIMELMPFYVFVGGDLLDRGVTIEGLSVVYMLRDSQTAQMDTSLQRARWFGYKSNYIDTCKVYMTKTLDEQFSEMVKPEEDLWYALEDCSMNNLSPKDCDFTFNMDSNLVNPTSKSKAEFGNVAVGLKTQQSYFTINESLNSDNKKLLDKFFIDNFTKTKSKKWGPLTHLSFNSNLGEVIKIISNFNFSGKDNQCNTGRFLNLIDRLQLDNNTEVEVLKMQRTGSVEERSTIDNSNRLQALLFQGHSANVDPSDTGNYYPGDGYLVSDKLMLQIHYVSLKNDVIINDKIIYKKGSIVPMIAWLFPKTISTKKVIGKISY